MTVKISHKMYALIIGVKMGYHDSTEDAKIIGGDSIRSLCLCQTVRLNPTKNLMSITLDPPT